MPLLHKLVAVGPRGACISVDISRMPLLAEIEGCSPIASQPMPHVQVLRQLPSLPSACLFPSLVRLSITTSQADEIQVPATLQLLSVEMSPNLKRVLMLDSGVSRLQQATFSSHADGFAMDIMAPNLLAFTLKGKRCFRLSF